MSCRTAKIARGGGAKKLGRRVFETGDQGACTFSRVIIGGIGRSGWGGDPMVSTFHSLPSLSVKSQTDEGNTLEQKTRCTDCIGSLERLPECMQPLIVIPRAVSQCVQNAFYLRTVA